MESRDLHLRTCISSLCFFSLLPNIPFHTLVYFRDGSAQTILRAATLRQKLQIKAFHLTQSQYTDTGPTSPRADPIAPGAWQGSHWNANVTGMTRPRKKPSASRVHTEISRSRGGHLTHGHRCGAFLPSLPLFLSVFPYLCLYLQISIPVSFSLPSYLFQYPFLFLRICSSVPSIPTLVNRSPPSNTV